MQWQMGILISVKLVQKKMSRLAQFLENALNVEKTSWHFLVRLKDAEAGLIHVQENVIISVSQNLWIKSFKVKGATMDYINGYNENWASRINVNFVVKLRENLNGRTRVVYIKRIYQTGRDFVLSVIVYMTKQGLKLGLQEGAI